VAALSAAVRTDDDLWRLTDVRWAEVYSKVIGPNLTGRERLNATLAKLLDTGAGAKQNHR